MIFFRLDILPNKRKNVYQLLEIFLKLTFKYLNLLVHLKKVIIFSEEIL